MAAVVATHRGNRLGAGTDMRPLLVRTNRHAVAFLIVHLTALAASGFWLWTALGTWAAVPATLGYGVVLAHLFALLHECTHRTAFRARGANRALALVTGLVIGLPPRYFSLEHTAHHLHTQDAELDPELIPLPRSLAQYTLFVVGGPYWWWAGRTLVTHAAGRVLPFEQSFVPERERRRIVREARVFLAVYAAAIAVSVATGSTVLVWFWLVPRLVGEPSMRIARLAEHAGRPRTSDVTENTRSLRVPAPLRVLAWNMPYHAEHHASPSVPFHRLPVLHDLLAPRLQGRRDGYIAAHVDIIRRIVRHEGPGV
jgi:fatty acid desaturase